MLRRSLFAQKRHLESSIAKCVCLPHNATFNFTQGPRFASQLPMPNLSSDISKPTSGNPQHPGYTTNLRGYYIHTPTPRDFIHIMAALASHQPLEKILRFIRKSSSLLHFFSNRRTIREIAKELAQSPKPHHSIQILNLAYHLGHTLNASAYESVSFRLAQSRNWDMILGVVGAARKHVGHTTLRLLNWRALALMESQRYSSLRRILDEFQAADITPIRRTYHIILSGCLRNHDLAGAKRSLQDMRDAGIHMDATTHALISNSYRKFGVDPQVRYNALASLPGLTPGMRTTVVNNILQSALDADDLSTAFRLLSLFRDKTVISTLSLASTKFAFERIQPNSVNLPPLLGLDVKPNSDTFALSMNYLIQNLDYEGSLEVANKSILLGIPPSANLVTSLVHTYFLQGQGDNAIHMLSHLSVTSKTEGWNALRIDSLGGHDLPLLILTHVPLTTRMFNALLRGILNRQGLSLVPNIFSIMYANNIRPNARTIEVLLSYMNQVNIPHPRTFFQVLRALTTASPIRPSVQHMHNIVSRIFRDERAMVVRSAWSRHFAKRMDSSRLRRRKRIPILGTTDSFDPLAGIEIGKHLSYRTAARPTVQSLTAHEVKTDSVMVFLRIRRQSVLHLDVDSAHRFLETLMARGMHPNVYHFGALVEGYALAGRFASALEVMKSASNSGVKPNIVMYTNLIAAYARRQDIKSAVSMFKAMLAAGITPDIPSIDAVVSAFHAKGDHKTARDLLKALWVYIQPFPKNLADADLETLLSHFRSVDSAPSKKAKFTLTKRLQTYLQVRKIIRAYRRYFGSRARPKRIRRRARKRECNRDAKEKHDRHPRKLCRHLTSRSCIQNRLAGDVQTAE